MAQTELVLRKKIQRMLGDAATAVYGTAELYLEMYDALYEMAQYAPNVQLATVTTVDGTAEVDVSSLTNLMYGVDNPNSYEAVEFTKDKEPRNFRNFSVLKGKMMLDIDFTPSVGEEVRLYIRRPHECYDSTGSASTSTLDNRLENIFVNLVAGRAASNHAIASVNKSNIGGAKSYIDFMTWGEKKADNALTNLKRMRKTQISIQYPREP